MEKITLLVAIGPNSVEIPCRVMRSIDDAHDFCKKLGLKRSEKSELQYKLPDLDSKDNAALAKALFTNYYGGCGEAFALVLHKVGFNETFIGWDLD